MVGGMEAWLKGGFEVENENDETANTLG